MRSRWRGLLTALTLTFTLGAAADEAPLVNLFDGQSLAGWVPEHTDRFRVRDGVIHNDGGTGWLRSAKTYKNFEFHAEYRALKPGSDSGLVFRATPESTPTPQHWPVKGYQLQVIDAKTNFMILGHGTPAKFDRKADVLESTMRGPGQWQTIVLRVVGKHAEASLNGVPITVSDAISLPDGFLGLLGENGQFEWRALKIKELPAP